MNETLRIIDSRHSTRVFDNTPVSQSEKELIFNAAYRAPTAGNMMLYSIIEIDDQALKETLAETCDNQPFIAMAPLVLIFLADYQRWWDYYNVCEAPKRAEELERINRKPQEGDFLLACCDALIAAQTAAIAAESLGIGSCYIGDIMEKYEIHRDLFNLPRYVFPIAMLCFGFPQKTDAVRKRSPRYNPGFMTFKNQYHRLDEPELKKMFAPYEEMLQKVGQPIKGAVNFGQHNYLRKFTADFSFEMSRSVRAMLKNWTDK
jgi:FMN reductase (NADPH)/FMN reductase [NAD(P)H]